MSSLSVDIYFRLEVMIIQHPDSYFRHIEVSEKIGLQKSPHRLMGGYRWPVDYICVQVETDRAFTYERRSTYDFPPFFMAVIKAYFLVDKSSIKIAYKSLFNVKMLLIGWNQLISF